jgi:magnesium chelatase subunit I
MNPEEGQLRPQIMDRFGLRVMLHGLEGPQERLEAYKRVQAYLTNPHHVIGLFGEETEMMRQEILAARRILPKVSLPEEVTRFELALIQSLNIDSLRADITFFEAARAHAAADGRSLVTLEDLKTVAPIALRLRRSRFMDDYFARQVQEEAEILDTIQRI